MVAQPGTQSSRYPLNTAMASDGGPKRSGRGKSAPPGRAEERQASRSPRGGNQPGVPVDDFDQASELRWYVIRELGQIRRWSQVTDKRLDRTAIDVDILKAKTREKLDNDQVKVRIIQALEHVPHLVDYERFK